MQTSELDILITGGNILTLGKENETVLNADMGIKDRKISFIRKADRSVLPYRAKKTVNASGHLIMPGIINTHTHLPMTCFRGLADDLPLMEWLNNYIFPAEAKYVNEEMVYYGSLLAIAEMILSGTTTFCDGYFYEGSVAQAAIDAGIRGMTCQGFLDFPTPEHPEPSRNAEIAVRFVSRWSNVSPLITPALFCHSPYTCSPETIQAVKTVARESDTPFLIHLSETKQEVEEIKKRYGKTPLRHLDSLNTLDERTIAVHCVWLDNEEITLLGKRRVKVSHAPESNMKLASGIAPVPQMLKAGVTVGLGTDGCASNNDLDMFQEMSTAAKLHKIATMDPTAMNASTVLKMATSDGAKVLGLENNIGSLKEGMTADIIILDINKPHLTPLYDFYSHIVYAATGADVSTVIINGSIVMENRRLLTINLDDVTSRIRKIAENIKKDYK